MYEFIWEALCKATIGIQIRKKMRKVTLEQYCSKTQRSVIKNVNRPSLHFQKKQTETELTCVGHLQFVLMLNDSICIQTYQ